MTILSGKVADHFISKFDFGAGTVSLGMEITDDEREEFPDLAQEKFVWVTKNDGGSLKAEATIGRG